MKIAIAAAAGCAARLTIALTAVVLAGLPTGSFAATAKHKAKMAHTAMYACQKCHMKFSAAEAKKDHYKDPMDGGTLMPVKAAMKSSSKHPMSMEAKPMGGMHM